VGFGGVGVPGRAVRIMVPSGDCYSLEAPPFVRS
jgi:hypothetical protein